MLIGYARISTPDQLLDLQVDALSAVGCEAIYTEVASGARTERLEIQKAIAYAREGDTLVVWKLDRLGRSLRHLIEMVLGLEARKIHFRSLQEQLDTSTPAGKLQFHVFGALAEFERDLIRERTMAGLKAARARGKCGGRPRSLEDHQVQMLKTLASNRDNRISDLCSQFKISKATFYKYARMGQST